GGTSAADRDERKPYFPPQKVSVLPILHVPKGLPAPDPALARMIYRHVQWSQRRYQELLGTTFKIAVPATKMYRGRYTLAEYRAFDNKVGPHIHAQHLHHLNVTRFNCPYVLFTVLYNPENGFPSGRGGSVNGGFNTGGGTVLMSSHDFTERPNAQSTIQHELGHAFGLPHVDAYGYPLKGDSPSIMTYNPKHHTNRFRPSSQPGILIAEDIRGLALNDRVFPDLDFDPEKHIPQGYEISPTIKSNSAGSYLGVPDYKLKSRPMPGKRRGRIFRMQCVCESPPVPAPQSASTDASCGFQMPSMASPALTLKFPFPVELSSMRIYSGHSGAYHPVTSASVMVPGDGGNYRELGSSDFQSLDGQVMFDTTESRSWRLALTPGKSRKVVLRGIRFYSGDIDIFRPAICLVKP
ncbi:MAG: hypothetical protein ABGZ24_18500, partial [Fuerstiella sp.]